MRSPSGEDSVTAGEGGAGAMEVSGGLTVRSSCKPDTMLTYSELPIQALAVGVAFGEAAETA